MDTIYHIRRPLKKQRGNQFYKDYSRGQGTYCGAPETAFDVPHRGRACEWTNAQIHHIPCKECCRIRAKTKTLKIGG
jgi:hypothetical protein